MKKILLLSLLVLIVNFTSANIKEKNEFNTQNLVENSVSSYSAYSVTVKVTVRVLNIFNFSYNSTSNVQAESSSEAENKVLVKVQSDNTVVDVQVISVKKM